MEDNSKRQPDMNSEPSNGESGSEQSTEEIVAGDLAELTKEAAELKNKMTEREKEDRRIAERYATITSTILKTLELMDLETVRAHGFLFFKEEKSSVTTPKTLEDKKALFDYLESKGIFLEIASVNSQTLNSLYKTLAEEAAKEGVLEFKLPGVEEPKNYTTLKLRRS